MPTFNVTVSNRANRDLANLQAQTRLRVLKGIKQPGIAPFPRGNTIRRIEGVPEVYRLRVGDYRVVYRIEDT